ncbi:MAG TPA: outer membrane beta-barrel domain-containing protein [Myxococcota bacterium]|nr:outer membrane beta-barrel domain-containing protein [Myxococcota bacterium]HRY96272.1 outer membrane beta-barrel domain-containing protein [Myxococcota bacterium]HSA23822.1 outer membrane beta-barrel domain-containing protein [Myxococcota bacterium]
MLRKLIPAALLCVLLAVPAARAQDEEESGSLRDRIKGVSGKLYLKSGRLELTLLPLTSISLNDAFYQKLGGGLQLAYHFSDAWALGLTGTYSLNLDSGNANYYGRQAEDIPYAGKRNFLFSLEGMWAPLYGKISVAAEWTLHYDTYILLGLGGIGGDQTGGDLSFGVAGTVGLGARLFFLDWLALRLEFRDYLLFNDKVSYDKTEKTDVQNQLMINIGLSFFVLDADPEE